MELAYAVIGGTRITALPVMLEALTRAHDELTALGAGVAGKKGLVFAPEVTASWRSETLQRQLVAKGASKTMYSNHRAGVAVDVFPDWTYIAAIAPVMRKHGLVNDLAYALYSGGDIVAVSAEKKPGYVAWDGGHFNLGSNANANTYRIINSQLIINPFVMDAHDYDGLIVWNVEGDGGFALVQGGKRRSISEARAGKAALAVEATGPANAQRKVVPVPKGVWDSLPEGEKF